MNLLNHVGHHISEKIEEVCVLPKRKKTEIDMTEDELLMEKFKQQVLLDMGFPKDTDLSMLTARECGAIGGRMVKKMIESAKDNINKEISHDVSKSFEEEMNNVFS